MICLFSGKMALWAIAKQFELSGKVAFANNFMRLLNHKTVRTFAKLQCFDISSDILYTGQSLFALATNMSVDPPW